MPKKVRWSEDVYMKVSSKPKIFQRSSATFSQLKSIALPHMNRDEIRRKLCRGVHDVTASIHHVKCQKDSLIANPHSNEPYWVDTRSLFFVSLEQNHNLIGLYESIDTEHGFSINRVSDSVVPSVIRSLLSKFSPKAYRPIMPYENGQCLPSQNKIAEIKISY